MAERGNRHIPILEFLVRDAQPLWREIEGEPDARERRRNQRAYDLARDELIRRYAEAEAASALPELDPRVRDLCDQWKEQNGGRLPQPKGGAPADPHFRMMLHMAVFEEIEAQGGRSHGVVDRALHSVATRAGRSYQSLRAIYYDRDPEWIGAAKAEWSCRKYEASVWPGPTARIDPRPIPVERSTSPKRPNPRRRGQGAL